MTLTPNYQESVDFLHKFRPVGFWLLTAIRLDKKEIKTMPFAASDPKSVLGWLEKMGKERENSEHNFNFYFHVNPVMQQMAKKAEKEDVSRMEYLHVDLDPRSGEDVAEEKKRYLSMLTDSLPEDIPEPTFVVDSGGGYHGYWKLETPLEIEGQPNKWAEAERYNQQIITEFGGDIGTFNVDRILRLPGTLNRPDKKKREKGRTICLSTVIKETDKSYPLSSFVPAPLVQANNGFADHLSMVEIQGEIPTCDDVDELEKYGVPQHTRIVIVQGLDPDDPHRWESRSEPLWYVTNSMVRCQVPDEMILSILENPLFKISESVLEKGPKAGRKYALKQINDAKEETISPMLQKLNAKHAVVRSVGGSCRIISEEWDEELGRLALDYQTATDFNTYYQNQKMEMTVKDAKGEDKIVSVPLGKWWLTHPHRRSYERVIFAPDKDFPGSYNLWTGFGVEPKPGKCDLYLAHLRNNICSGNEEYFNYLLGWMACAVQRPGEQGHTAIVLQGKRGTGKGVFASNFGALFGRHFMTVTHGDHLVGKFNAHLRDCVLLFGDEAFFAGDKKHEGMLKVLITERLLMTEKKGVDAQTGRNYTHVILASNDDWVVPAGENERRFFILRVSDGELQKATYFNPIIKEMEEQGGREALLHYLMHYDLSDFNVRDVPKTDALQSQKEHTFSTLEGWWYSKLQDGQIIEGQEWPNGIPRATIREDLANYVRSYGAPLRSNATALGQFMKRVFPDNWDVGKRLPGIHEIPDGKGNTITVDRPNGYLLPPLSVCRDHWEEMFGGKFNWMAVAEMEQADLGLKEEAF